MLIDLEFGNIGYSGERKAGKPGEKPSGQEGNQQQTQPTDNIGSE